jgi:hypothetical protein
VRARIASAFRRLHPQERIALLIALGLAALATIGQGIVFFSGEDWAFDVGMPVMIVFSSLAGVALAFEADIFPTSLDVRENHRKSLQLIADMEQTLLVCAVELLVGEVLFLVALATAAPGLNGDISIILAPVLIGVLGGGLFCLLGLLVGMLVVWPLVLVVRYVLGRRSHKPTNPVTLPLALLFITIVAMAILSILGTNPPDVIGTPTGRGLYDIVFLYTNYSGTLNQQVLAWIARALGLVLAVEVMWIRRVGHVHGIGENMTVDPPRSQGPKTSPVRASSDPRS